MIAGPVRARRELRWTRATPLHTGDMLAQVNQALDNVEAVLKGAGMALPNVGRLNMYTTDVDAVMGNLESSVHASPRPGSRTAAPSWVCSAWPSRS